MTMSQSQKWKTLPTPDKYQLYTRFLGQPAQSIASTASFFQVSKETIKNAIKSADRQTAENKNGRKQKLTEEAIVHIEAKTIANRRMGGGWMSREIEQLFGIKCSRKTIDRVRQKLGFQYRPPIEAVLISKSALIKRVNWCKLRLDISTDWDRIVFSDESYFELRGNGQWLWRRPDENGNDVRV
jgi:transposase